MFFTFAWLINLAVYYLLVRAVILITPVLIKYGETHEMNEERKMIYDTLCNFTDRVHDYLLRHDQDFNALTFQDVAYKMVTSAIGEGIQDKILEKVGNPYSGKLRWGVFDTPEYKVERINTTVGWDSKEYVGFQYGFRF